MQSVFVMGKIEWARPLRYPPRVEKKHRAVEGGEMKLDEILVAGSVRIANLQLALRAIQKEWARTLILVLEGKIPRSQEAVKEDGQISSEKWTKNLEQLRDWRVLRETSATRAGVVLSTCRASDRTILAHA